MSQPHDEQIDNLLHEVANIDVPEPSPLFWDHFAARVNAAIDAPPPRRWWQSRALLVGTATAAMVLISIASYVIEPAPQGDRAAVATSPPIEGTITDRGNADGPSADTIGIEHDEAWAVVSSFAEELQYDDAREAGVLPRPGSVERAATELPAEERAELVRIIQDELKRTGA